MNFEIPNLGENVEKADVSRVLVAVGDVMKVDQSLFELETDKATVEVPSTVAGKITEIKVKAGDKVKGGQVAIVVDESAAAPAAEKRAETKADTKTEAAPAAAAPAKSETAKP